MTLQGAYYLVLGALILSIAWKGSTPMMRTVAAFVAVAFVSLCASGLWPTPTYSIIMIAADAAACLVITLKPAGNWQAAIGLSYIFQIICHLIRIALGKNADIDSFYWGLTAWAVIQLLLLGGWLGHELLGYTHLRGRTRDFPARPRVQGDPG